MHGQYHVARLLLLSLEPCWLEMPSLQEWWQHAESHAALLTAAPSS